MRLTESLDLTELELPGTMKTHFPDPTNVLKFNLTITPDEGQCEPLDRLIVFPSTNTSLSANFTCSRGRGGRRKRSMMV